MTNIDRLLADLSGPTVPDPIVPPTYGLAFAIVPVVIALVFALIIVLIVRNVRRARKLGVDPTTLHTDVAARYLREGIGRTEAPLGERLAELDRLRAAGTITDDEHARARAAALGGTSPDR
jgi:uncharacterized membrane protein